MTPNNDQEEENEYNYSIYSSPTATPRPDECESPRESPPIYVTFRPQDALCPEEIFDGPSNFLGTDRSTSPDPSTNERHDAFAKYHASWINNKAHIRVELSAEHGQANIIGSHTKFKLRDDGSLKARIVPWGHRDSERHFLRTDSPCVKLDIFRLVLSLAAEHSWPLGQMDVSTELLQAKGTSREIFVRPTKEANETGSLWKLQSPAYGLVDSRTISYITSDHALVSKYNLTKSRLEPTLYYKQCNGNISFVLGTLVDNYSYTSVIE